VVKRTPHNDCSDVVETEHGYLRGRRLAAVWAFKGIPYAAPPIGKLRWKPPRPPKPWRGVRPASGFGYVCMQVAVAHEPQSHAVGSEDCLTLNVWTPSIAPAKLLPVLFFIHGGFHVVGASSARWRGVDAYDGTYLASQGAVVVTINYRLGPLGFLSHHLLSQESTHRSSGNYGILDQLAALRWVQRNIHAFGGDPSRVTVFGHSAGATDALVLVASPLARGLFSRAILLSGQDTTMPLKRAENYGGRLAAALGCHDKVDILACLRSRSASELITELPASFALRGVHYLPNVDGWVLPAPALSEIEAGHHNAVPVIVGTTTNEMSTLIQQYVHHPIENSTDYRAALRVFFEPRLVAYAEDAYPPHIHRSPYDALLAATNDYGFTCSARQIARAFAYGQREPVWRLLFSYSHAAESLKHLGAGHGMELPFIFHNFPNLGRAGFHKAKKTATWTIARYWLNFIEFGQPDDRGDVADWAPYDPIADNYLEIGRQAVSGRGYRALQCNAWEKALLNRA
jgi:para-nitrobenzyl esterase